MSVAKVSEISATSPKEQHIHIDQGKVTEYRVNMMITFVLDD